MKVSVVGLFADRAVFENGILSFQGVRIEFSPSDRPHEDLLTSPEENIEVEVTAPSVRVEEVTDTEEIEVSDARDVVEADNGDIFLDDFLDDGELMAMDLSE